MPPAEQIATKTPDTAPEASQIGGRGTTIGVHIDRNGLRLARLSHAKLVDFKYFPAEGEIDVGSPAFISFLRGSMSKFCGGYQRASIWATYAFPSMHVRHIRIPRVTSRQVSNAVYWTVKKEVPFDDAETLLDHVVEGEVTEDGVRKIAVTAYTVSREQAHNLKQAFSASGFRLAGITIPFFAFRNMFTSGWIAIPDRTAVCLSIGDDYSQITIFAGKHVVLTRGIKTGMDVFVDLVRQSVAEPHAHRARELLLEMGSHKPQTEDGGRQVTDDELFDMIVPALMRLIRQIERTLGSHGSRGEHPKRIYVSGEISACQRVLDYIGEQLGAGVHVINPLASHHLAKKAASRDGIDRESVLYASAVGAALSDVSHTPNLLYTHKEKETVNRARRFNIGVLATSGLAAAALAGAFLWQGVLIAREKFVLSALQAKIDEFDPRLDQSSVAHMAVRARLSAKRLRGVARSHVGSAVISELSSITPGNVRLVSLGIDLAAPTREKSGDDEARTAVPGKKAAGSGMAIEGIVTGSRRELASRLAKYVLQLESSPLLCNVEVERQGTESREGREELSFALSASLVCLD